MSDTPLSTTQRWRAHTERQAQGLSPKGRRGGGARAATTPRGRRRRPPRHAPQRLPNDTWGTAGGDQRTQLGRAAAIVVGHGSWGGGGGRCRRHGVRVRCASEGEGGSLWTGAVNVGADGWGLGGGGGSDPNKAPPCRERGVPRGVFGNKLGLDPQRSLEFRTHPSMRRGCASGDVRWASHLCRGSIYGGARVCHRCHGAPQLAK